MISYSLEELDALAIIDPELDAIRKSGKIPRPDIDYTDHGKAVQHIRDLAEAWGKLVVHDRVFYERTVYHARDGYENRLLVFRPAELPKEERLPLIVHIHGGGGCVGSPESTADFCQDLVLQHHCVVVATSYRLAPEFKFPIGLTDCVDAVKHISAHAGDYGADLSLGFVIGGHSYGASASSVISLHAKEVGLEATITGLYLAAGSYIGQNVPEGYQECFRSRIDERCNNSPVLDRRMAALFTESYAANHTSIWYRACNVNSSNAFRVQPRTYFQVCGMDILRDDSFIYRDILVNNGVETKIDVYPGMPHVFWNVFRPGSVKQSDIWANDTREGFKWLLRQT